MSYLTWTDELNTGIEVIDAQHRKIVDYINQLHDARANRDMAMIGKVIEALVDYTVSHFGFEEALIEDAGYEFAQPHKKVHELFIKRISGFQTRFASGEDISEELHALLSRWLFNHINNDDAAYVSAVKGKAQELVEEQQSGGWLSRTLRRFF